MLWSVVQLNRAFGSRGRLRVRQSMAPREEAVGPFWSQEENGGRCVTTVVTVSGSYICP